MSDPRHQVMEEFSDRPVRNKSAEERDALRWARPLTFARTVVEHTAARVKASQELLGREFYRGDCHSHTQHSDGMGTVAESAAMVEAAGFDFFWVTDHWGLTQTPECREHGLWAGQEPTTEHYHLGILSLGRTYTPVGVLEEDIRRIEDLGGTPFVAHPAGWWPRKVYTQEEKDALKRLPSPFLMEVMNGAGNLVTAYDYTDAEAVRLWDELLCEGLQVHGLGNTDAHAPHQIGIVWNGVFAAQCDEASIVGALRAGRCFASEAAVMELKVGTVEMGGRVEDCGAAGPLTFKVADSHGLLRVRLIGDGQVLDQWTPDGKTLVSEERPLPAQVARYIRVEAISLDGRRAFSNPVYL